MSVWPRISSTPVLYAKFSFWKNDVENVYKVTVELPVKIPNHPSMVVSNQISHSSWHCRADSLKGITLLWLFSNFFLENNLAISYIVPKLQRMRDYCLVTPINLQVSSLGSGGDHIMDAISQCEQYAKEQGKSFNSFSFSSRNWLCVLCMQELNELV